MDQKAYEIAEKLVIASKRAYNRGIQTGSGGNVSARIPGTETMLVKASGGACLFYTSGAPRGEDSVGVWWGHFII